MLSPVHLHQFHFEDWNHRLPNRFHYSSLFSLRAHGTHVDTLGAEKKSGVPYILTSLRRHRQTPLQKHDQKARHVGLTHVAQPSYRAFAITLAKFPKWHTIRCCVRAGGLWGLPSSSEGSGGHGVTTLPVVPRFCPTSFGWRRSRGDRPTIFGHAGRMTLPLFLGRWRVLDATSRRAITSRKAVPADVKEPFSFHLTG